MWAIAILWGFSKAREQTMRLTCWFQGLCCEAALRALMGPALETECAIKHAAASEDVLMVEPAFEDTLAPRASHWYRIVTSARCGSTFFITHSLV
eukprot:4970504-Alexandrium_andersonii.AAC.2